MYWKFDIILVNLNPTKGSEQAGIRPCIIIQNDLANQFSNTYVVAIISSTIKTYPHTLIVDPSSVNGLKQRSRIDFLQVRTIDSTRIIKKWGSLEKKYHEKANQALSIAFSL